MVEKLFKEASVESRQRVEEEDDDVAWWERQLSKGSNTVVPSQIRVAIAINLLERKIERLQM